MLLLSEGELALFEKRLRPIPKQNICSNERAHLFKNTSYCMKGLFDALIFVWHTQWLITAYEIHSSV